MVAAINSLKFLADVALGNQPRILTNGADPGKSNNMLTVRNVNGETYANIRDLKCVSFDHLLGIFIEATEDKRTRCPILLCKYEESGCCNARFFIRTDRKASLRDVVRCHLMEHLIKSENGSMTKLPKLRTAANTNIKVRKPRSVATARSNKEGQGIVYGKTFFANVVSVPSESAPIRGSQMTTLGVIELRQVVSDHPYCEISERSSTIINSSVLRTGLIEIVWDDSLDSRASHRSYNKPFSKPSSFTIRETLNPSVSMMPTGDAESTLPQVPFFASEVVVTTEKEMNEPAVTAECKPKRSTSFFPCSECDIEFSSKQMLCTHMRNKHFDSSIKSRPYRAAAKTRTAAAKTRTAAAKTRTAAAEPKTVKRKFEMRSEYRNADLYEVVKENNGAPNSKHMNVGESILKTALLKESNKKPVINIGNVLHNVNNVQYIL